MKVLLSAFQCGPGEGSELGNAWRWALNLQHLGHEVTVLTPSRYREAIDKKGRHGLNFQFVDLPASSLERISSRLATYQVYSGWQDAALEHITNQARDYDVAHHVAWGSLHLGSMLWRLPLPFVYGPIGGGQTAPGNYRHYFGKDWPSERLRTATTGSLLRLNARSRRTIVNSAVVLVTNSATAAACRRLGGTHIRYMLAEGLPDEWLSTARPQPSGVPIVLWVGRMLSRKAPVLTIRAFAELRRVMAARLVMVGDGPLMGDVQAEVARLGLADDVDLQGRLPWEDLKRHYDAASVFLFNSLRDSSGAQFLEALGRGLPAVALDLHGIADAEVGSGAIKVPLPEDPRKLPGLLADALRTVLTDEKWEVRSAAGTEWAAQHVWSAKAAAATGIYQELLARHRG
jgi:glycosyltransferase involved in cell wall biosynthesis